MIIIVASFMFEISFFFFFFFFFVRVFANASTQFFTLKNNDYRIVSILFFFSDGKKS